MKRAGQAARIRAPGQDKSRAPDIADFAKALARGRAA